MGFLEALRCSSLASPPCRWLCAPFKKSRTWLKLLSANREQAFFKCADFY
jgi:hypothetical protein